MTSQARLSLKSPIILVGLFCLFCLLSGCRKVTDPEDVTIMFWTAVAEGNFAGADQYSNSFFNDIYFSQRLYGASLQTGKVHIVYENAMVETIISLETAASGYTFYTFLNRQPQNNQWFVDYRRTIENIPSRQFKNVFTSLKENGIDATVQAKENTWPLIKQLFASIVNAFKRIGRE